MSEMTNMEIEGSGNVTGFLKRSHEEMRRQMLLSSISNVHHKNRTSSSAEEPAEVMAGSDLSLIRSRLSGCRQKFYRLEVVILLRNGLDSCSEVLISCGD